MSFKRKREHFDIPIEEQMEAKRKKITNKILDAIDNPGKEICKSKDIKINNINFNVDVGPYNVQIISAFGVNKFQCSCNSLGVYHNFSSNYCKHISYALSHLVKIFVSENENFFKEKKCEIIMKENIEFLKSNIKDLNINDK